MHIGSHTWLIDKVGLLDVGLGGRFVKPYQYNVEPKKSVRIIIQSDLLVCA
jgi:hypothetical protein